MTFMGSAPVKIVYGSIAGGSLKTPTPESQLLDRSVCIEEWKLGPYSLVTDFLVYSMVFPDLRM
jgi:hypothetical protein